MAWCSWLLDQGYRGEMECIVAKIFGSEAQKEAAIELFMKTHGGRAFLHGHLFGDNVHEYLAPCIYEGEGEMLGMGFFKSLIKEHGKTYFEPIGKALQAAGIRKPNPLNPAHAWALRERRAAVREVAGLARRSSAGITRACPSSRRRWPSTPSSPPRTLQRSRLEIAAVMRKHQLKLADRQCRMAELSQRLQDLVVILATASGPAGRRTGSSRTPPTSSARTSAASSPASGRPTPTSGPSPSSARPIAEGGFEAIAGIEAGEILMPYPA